VVIRTVYVPLGIKLASRVQDNVEVTEVTDELTVGFRIGHESEQKVDVEQKPPEIEVL
jgi:hypothetical protein